MVRESLLTRLDRWLTELAKAGPFRGRSSIGNGCVPQQCSVSLSSALCSIFFKRHASRSLPYVPILLTMPVVARR